MSLKTFTIPFTNFVKDRELRNDLKFHEFIFFSDWNLFNSKCKKLIPLKEILEEDHCIFDYQEDETYK